MNHSKGALLVYTIIGLAVIGVITQLFTNTASFLTNILSMLVFAIVILAVMYFVFFRKQKPSSDDNKKYKQAVKQSKAKYSSQQDKSNKPSRQSRPISFKKKSNKRPTHLRVIDGNKSKRKNRASF